MKKKLLVLLSSILMTFFMFIPVKAGNDDYVVDEAGLLTTAEIDDLNELAAVISDIYECGIYVRVTADSKGTSSIEELSEYLFDTDNLGYGLDRSMVLLTINMEESEVEIDSYGKGNDYFTDNDKNWILDRVIPYLSDGEWHDAFAEYIGDAELMLQTPLGTSEPYPTEKKNNLPMKAGISALIGAIVAAINTASKKGKMKNTGIKRSAANYVTRVNLSLSRDYFTHTTRTVQRIQRNTNSGSGRSSGGTIHSGHTSISSSGHGHSGGRKF